MGRGQHYEVQQGRVPGPAWDSVLFSTKEKVEILLYIKWKKAHFIASETALILQLSNQKMHKISLFLQLKQKYDP